MGILGGGFDPIHIGHIHLALELKEGHRLDEVIFVPAFCSPFKKKSGHKAEAKHRLQMTRLAVHGISGFTVSDWEIRQKKVSYTIDTLLAFQRKGERLFLLLSEEAAASFSLWKQPEEVVKIASLLIGKRGKKPVKIPKKFLPYFKKGITNTKIIEVSSTMVRQRMKEGKYVGHFLHPKVLTYIKEKHLYDK